MKIIDNFAKIMVKNYQSFIGGKGCCNALLVRTTIIQPLNFLKSGIQMNLKTNSIHPAETSKTTNNKKGRTRVALIMASALIGATALTSLATVIPTQTAKAESTLNRAPKQGFADLVEQVMPSVVSVEVRFAPVADTQTSQQRYGFGSEGSSRQNPFDFFSNRDQRSQRGHSFVPKRQLRKGKAVGSGFIISADGYVITNNHVVKNASTVYIKLSDGEEYKAKVIGTDPKTDLAVLKIESNKTFKFVKLANNDPRVGDWVVAVGNPYGLGGTVTTGIVSARGRDIGSGPYDNFLQIDASINRGNSGGPAFNLKGEVIGVNTAIFSPSGGSVGIGFAIPASTTKRIVDDLLNKGNVTRGWLGVQIQSVTKDIADSMGLKSAKGTLVAKVTDGSPAQKGGLKRGDTILRVNGQAVKGPRALARKIAEVKPGQIAKMDIIRKGKNQTVEITIGKMPGADKLAALSKKMPSDQAPKLAKLGIAVEEAQDGMGVVVRATDPNGIAASKGIRPGDIIVEVAGIEIDGPRSLKAALARAGKSGDSTVLMLVLSKGRQRFIAMPLKRS